MNSAIVFSQRFYMFHQHQKKNRFCMASAAIFLAAKMDAKIDTFMFPESIVSAANEHIRVRHTPEVVQKQVWQLIEDESLLLQVLGFGAGLDVVHPHYHIAKSLEERSEAIYNSNEDSFTKDLKIQDEEELHRR